MTVLLSRTALLTAKLPHIDVPVPEMGPDAVVRVQQMSVNTRATYLERIRLQREAEFAYEDDQLLPVAQQKGVQKPADLDPAVLGLVYSLVDDQGAFLFTEADMPMFNTMSQIAVTRMWEATLELNRYDTPADEDVAAEKKG